jgi:hypothetical protein
MKGFREVEVQLHVFLASALDGGEWTASGPYPGERTPGALWTEGWAGSTAGLDAVVNEIIKSPWIRFGRNQSWSITR